MRLRFIGIWFACYAACAGSAAVALFATHAVLEPLQQARFDEALSAAAGLLLSLAFFLFALSGVAAQWLVGAFFRPLRRLTEGARLIASSNPGLRMPAEGAAEVRQLAQAINLLAAGRQGALQEVDSRIAQAHADLDEERNRLAALMSELAQSVIVCNADGRILLYNQHARELFHRGPAAAAGKASSTYIGLGRSLFSLIERDLFVHFAEQLRSHVAQDENQPVAAFMIVAGAGRLLHARMAPVRPMTGAGKGSVQQELFGYVLLLEDVSQEVLIGEQRDRLQQRLLENARAALGSIRAAVENLINYPEADAERRHRFLHVIHDEARRFGAAIEQATHDHVEHVRSHWSPQQVRAADLLELVRRRLESNGGPQMFAADLDADTWVNADSYSMMLAFSYLARRVARECGVQVVQFGVAAVERHVRFEMTWPGARLPAATALAWEHGALDSSAGAEALTFREVLQRHRGETWYEYNPVTERSSYRILLPAAVAGGSPRIRRTGESRPEYYDFDLFHQPGQTPELDDLPLRALTCTVFDTETTGLDPSGGDEIVSIGAVRIVNGRVLGSDVFEQLVDPQRPIAAASVKIHGIRAEMLHGQPSIAPVLAEFHRYCEDTVLIGHNAAFDMRFLQLKEAATGIRFSQPVLDTLLLSAVLHGDLESHVLEAIAERYGVDVVGRHTAVGDAIVTGEIFLRMIPTLEERGIVTLRQAREASQRTFYARVRY